MGESLASLTYTTKTLYKMSDEDLDDLDQLGSGAEVSEDKRALHNLMERKRRDSIKDSFRSLQDSIPNLKGTKLSRAGVLKKTGDHISFMQKKIARDQKDIKDITVENKKLEAQIAALEQARATGNFGATESILDLEALLTDQSQASIEVRENVQDRHFSELFEEDEEEDLFEEDEEEGGDLVDDITVESANMVTVPTFVTYSRDNSMELSLEYPQGSVEYPHGSVEYPHGSVEYPHGSMSVETAQPGQSLLRTQPGINKFNKFKH